MRNFFIFFFVILSTAKAADLRLISVSGMAKKSFEPDIVHLNLNVWGNGESAKKAQSNNQLQFEVLKKAVEAFKIKKEDIQTTSYDLSPEVTYDEKIRKNVTKGYNVNQGITLTLRKVGDAGPFIDSLSSSSKSMAGGISIQSLGYDIANRSEEEKNLLQKAVKEAESKAEFLADAANVKVKGLYHLAPKGEVGPEFMRYSEMKSDASMMAKSASTEMMTGEVKVSAEVQAQYIIE